MNLISVKNYFVLYITKSDFQEVELIFVAIIWSSSKLTGRTYMNMMVKWSLTLRINNVRVKNEVD
jgi:hypothetical protein